MTLERAPRPASTATLLSQDDPHSREGRQWSAWGRGGPGADLQWLCSCCAGDREPGMGHCGSPGPGASRTPRLCWPSARKQCARLTSLCFGSPPPPPVGRPPRYVLASLHELLVGRESALALEMVILTVNEYCISSLAFQVEACPPPPGSADPPLRWFWGCSFWSLKAGVGRDMLVSLPRGESLAPGCRHALSLTRMSPFIISPPSNDESRKHGKTIKV